MSLTYGSVCSGIEAATVAWHPLGWQPQFFSEIEAAPRAVLTHRWPGTPLHGDFTTIRAGEYGPIDLLVGGTPCQSFSVAGLRGGLADDRGNLALTFLAVVDRYRPRWIVYENVPGLLSSNGGRDFGAILGGMVELGYGFAYRVLDAQHVRVDGFGRAVPQRRRRVFVVGHLGDWRRPAAVLLERACLRGDSPPGRSQGAGVAVGALAGTGPGGGWRIGPDEAAGGQLVPSQQFGSNVGPTGAITGTLPAGNGNESGGVPCVAFDTTQITSAANRSAPHPGDPCHPLAAGAPPPAIAFDCKAGANTGFAIGAVPGALRGEGHGGGHAAVALDLRNGTAADVAMSLQSGGMGDDRGLCPNALPDTLSGWAVRRLTPTECERLMGFPDGHTLVPWRGGLLPDGPRYKCLGNSMATNVVRWIGRRIEMVERIGLSTLPTPTDPPAHRAGTKEHGDV